MTMTRTSFPVTTKKGRAAKGAGRGRGKQCKPNAPYSNKRSRGG